MVKKTEEVQLEDAKKLEDQLASVIEGEGLSIYSNDGIRLMLSPSKVRVGNKRKRRRKRIREGVIYEERPTVSKRSGERQIDEVAAFDSVVVGFSKHQTRGFRRFPVAIRFGAIERSPFVVSLRELTFSHSKLHEEERLEQKHVLAHDLAIRHRAPSIELLESLSHDLRISDPDSHGYAEQFTPSSFRSAFATSYSPLNQMIASVGNALPDLTGLFRKKNAKVVAIESNAKSEERVLAVPRWSYARTVAGLATLMIIATLPANAIRLYRSFTDRQLALTNAGRAAVADIESIRAAGLPESIEALHRASARFKLADELLSETNAVAAGLASILPSTRSTYRSAKALIEVGSASTDAAQLLATGLLAATKRDHTNALDRIGVFSAYAEGSMPLLDQAFEALGDIDRDDIPEERQKDIDRLVEGVTSARIAVREFVGLTALMKDLLGFEESRRYLIVFQNPHELRPTGGFMGSYAELDVDRGEITRFEIPGGGTYDLQGQLIAQVIPPRPLTLIADRWEFQDSNWSPDFPKAAEKMRYFWSKSGGYTVHGVIAVNATVIPELLKLTGPIEVPELGKTVTSENFMNEVQTAVEIDYDRDENKPKKILGLMAPILIERLKSLDEQGMLAALGILSDALGRKDIQIALTNPEQDELAQSYALSGRLKSTPGDSLAIVAANIAGQKTDGAIEEEVDHRVNIDDEGRIVDEVVIRRAHTARKGDLFQGVRNVTYFRVYVPRGSTLVSAEGFRSPEQYFFSKIREDAVVDTDEALIEQAMQKGTAGVDVWDEAERTVFGGWSQVDPGETVTIRLSYRLPFTAFDLRDRLGTGEEDRTDTGKRAAYSLLLTSQSGKPGRELHTVVVTPESWDVRWSRSGREYEGLWDRDRVISALYELK